MVGERFQGSDVATHGRRRQEFTTQVLRSIIVSAAEMADAMPGSNVVVAKNLAGGMTHLRRLGQCGEQELREQI